MHWDGPPAGNPAPGKCRSARHLPKARVQPGPLRTASPPAGATLINLSLSTSAAQSRHLPILLPAGIRRACHHRRAITPMHYRVMMAAAVRQGGDSGRFFFQAEDGIRDLTVTGVQTCALPI